MHKHSTGSFSPRSLLMSRKWFSIIALIATATFFLNVSSCGFNQHLVSIKIPPGATFNSVGPSIVFKAMGTYDPSAGDERHHRHRDLVRRIPRIW